MGIKDKLANIDVSGLTSVFKRDDDGENDGLRGGKGGGAHSGLGYTKDGGLSRGPWQRFDSGDGSSSDGGVGMLLYLTRGSQVFCLLVALFIDAHMLTAQKKWDVGPSSLVVFSLFVLILSVLSAAMMLLLPIVHEKTGKMRDISRGLRQLRPSFLINAINTSLMLIMAFTLTISANSKGCKNPENDPNAEKEGYLENGLPGFCRDKRALTAFLWLAFISWLVSLFFTLKAWRRSRSAPTIPAFRPPAEEEVKDGGSDSGNLESSAQRYDSVPEPPMSIPYNASASSPLSGSPYGVGGFQAHAAARQSGTFYEGGRPFDDPTPTGYGSSPYSNPYESQASPAYEDPYDRIRRERGA